MQIWVDADACPGVIKEILFRAAQRTRIMTTLVANQMLRVPPSPYIRARQVPSGFDVADQRIVEDVQPGDLVITADIPLAALVIERQAHALNPRGEFYTPENIRERLTCATSWKSCAAAASTSPGRRLSATATDRRSPRSSIAFSPGRTRRPGAG
jgi:uncharacterized protein YaiI (UPF0178 family)